MTATVFKHRIDTNLIDTGYIYKLDDFDRRQRVTGCFSFVVGPKQKLLDQAKLVDK